LDDFVAVSWFAPRTSLGHCRLAVTIALSPNGHEFLDHLRGNESKVCILDHLKAGAGLLSHSEGVDPIDLKQLTDARMPEAVGAGAN
jgi:hypothetical protein